MTRDVSNVLCQHTTDYTVRRELHRVPRHVTYEVTFDSRRAVCKLATDPEADLATEGRLLEFVTHETSVPVPAVLAVGSDHFIAAWHDGVPEPTPNDGGTETWARTAGVGMATLHAETEGAFDRTGFFAAEGDGPALRGHDSWPETIAAFLDSLREFLFGTGYADVAVEALEFVRDHPEAFVTPDMPVLCHGNYLPAHVGVAEGEVTCVIDFEHALFGSGEYDYWRTAMPVFGAGGQPGLEREFREGYESIRSLPDGLDRRAKCYRTLNTVSYFRSLFLQDQHNEAETERRAERMSEYVTASIDDLRGEFG